MFKKHFLFCAWNENFHCSTQHQNNCNLSLVPTCWGCKIWFICLRDEFGLLDEGAEQSVLNLFSPPRGRECTETAIKEHLLLLFMTLHYFQFVLVCAAGMIPPWPPWTQTGPSPRPGAGPPSASKRCPCRSPPNKIRGFPAATRPTSAFPLTSQRLWR
jgi:hypothetical protein